MYCPEAQLDLCVIRFSGLCQSRVENGSMVLIVNYKLCEDISVLHQSYYISLLGILVKFAFFTNICLTMLHFLKPLAFVDCLSSLGIELNGTFVFHFPMS